jgi:hypothetical protein
MFELLRLCRHAVGSVAVRAADGVAVVRIFASACIAGLLSAACPALSQEWSGGYAGLQFGGFSGSASDGADGDGGGAIAGVHAGYGVDVGSFVVGAEVDLDFGGVGLDDAADIDSIARLKLRAGTDLRGAFVYGTAGVARADTSLGQGEGGFAGVGAGWRLGARMTLGGEVLYQQFDDVDGSGVDIDGTTATARVTFSF